MAPIRLMVFPGAFNWPVWVGQDRDLFAENGVSVQIAETPGSVVQWTSLAKGDSDLAITLMDNVVAYREGQGEAPVTVPDAIAVMHQRGGDEYDDRDYTYRIDRNRRWT